MKYTDIKQPATKIVFLAECDPRGYNMGSWVINPKTKQWVDPFGIWHRDNSSTLSFADGHVDMHRWLSRGLVEWNLKALHEPASFRVLQIPRRTTRRWRTSNSRWMPTPTGLSCNNVFFADGKDPPESFVSLVH